MIIQANTDPGLFQNTARDWIGISGIVGTAATLLGLWLTFRESRKARSAAQAAADAAHAAGRRMAGVFAVVSLEQLNSQLRDLMHLLRGRNLRSSAKAAFELREAVAKLNPSPYLSDLIERKRLDALLKGIAEVHEILEAAAAINKIDAGARETCLIRVSQLHQEISVVAGTAASAAGGQ